MHLLSPLRYPGGKAALAPYLARLAELQYPRVTAYGEPFAGGAGAALNLLADEVVSDIFINDLNPGIAAMWRVVMGETERFASRILDQQSSVDAWERSRAICFTDETDDHEDFELGFATFLLNRWNRSGILDARPIGGLDQSGTWKIDARFNRQALAERVRYIGEYRKRVHVSQLDGIDFLATFSAEHPDALVYVDPPYLTQGADLYFDSLTEADHARLAAWLIKSKLRWFLTYDVDSKITEDLYPGLRCAEFRIAHTAHDQHVGNEYAIFSHQLIVPDIDFLPRSDSAWIAG